MHDGYEDELVTIRRIAIDGGISSVVLQFRLVKACEIHK